MKHKAGLIGYGNMGSWHVENINSRIEELEGKATQLITHDELRRSMKVLDAAFLSARTNQTVTL